MILLGFSSGNSLAFGRYVLLASGSEEADGWIARGIAIACITFAVTIHAVFPKWGMRLFDVLGVFKVVVLLFIVCSGFAALAGYRKVPDPHNFHNAVCFGHDVFFLGASSVGELTFRSFEWRLAMGMVEVVPTPTPMRY